MRAILVAAATGLVVAAVPGVASANHSGGNGPNYDKVDGTGETAQGGKVHVNARSIGGTPVGVGHFTITNSPFALNADVSGDVVCHHAGPPGRPNESATVGVIRKSSNPALIGAAPVLWIEDLGEPGSGRDRMLVGGLAFPPPAAFCALKPPDPKLVITQGNFIVHDGG